MFTSRTRSTRNSNGRDIALRCPRPRSSGRNGFGKPGAQGGTVAPLNAARTATSHRPYRRKGVEWKGTYSLMPHRGASLRELSISSKSVVNVCERVVLASNETSIS